MNRESGVTEAVPMHEAYQSAARRHLDDSTLLFGEGRFDNAAYLAGYVVECSIKSLIRAAGGPARALQHELAAICGDALLLAWLLMPSIRRFRLPETPEFRSLVAEWSTDLRYEATEAVDRTRATAWLSAAQAAYESIVVPAILDGQDAFE